MVAVLAAWVAAAVEDDKCLVMGPAAAALLDRHLGMVAAALVVYAHWDEGLLHVAEQVMQLAEALSWLGFSTTHGALR